MEGHSKTASSSRNCFRPNEADFNVIIESLKAKRPTSNVDRNPRPTSSEESEEPLYMKQDRNRREVMQRDQYLLSIRPNRQVAFAAKRAKIKNQGLSKQFETQVNIWNRELKRSCRVVGANEKFLEQELIRVNKKDSFSIPRLRQSYLEQEFKPTKKRSSKSYLEELPRLVNLHSDNGGRDSQNRTTSEGEEDKEYRRNLRLPDIIQNNVKKC